MRKIFLIAILSLIALPVFAYTRTPAGLEITSPVSFSFLPSDIGIGNWSYFASFKMKVMPNAYTSYYSPNCFISAEYPTGFTDIVSFPLGGYKFVALIAYEETDCSVSGGDFPLEGNYNDEPPFPLIFTIIPGPPSGVPSLFSISVASSSDLTANVGVLFTDLWVIIALVIGIPLAFYIIQRVSALPPKAG